jgi:DeoR/GlpR family transcriptional regulator of sugar metabolism
MQSVRNRNQTKPSTARGDAVTVKAVDVPDGVFARERQQQIARIVAENGRARVTDLAGRFRVSAVTIRKDLVVLEDEGRVIRTHGGAISLGDARPELAFDIRERLQREQKSRMGAAAAASVSDGESIVLDASTSALYVARNIKGRGSWHGLTVVTNSIRIASELAGHPGITVLMLGGRVRWEALSVVGPLGDGVFRRVNVQKAFLGAAGFSIEAGLSDAMEEEAQIKRAMVAAAREVFAVVDHTKWERVASATFCRTDRLTGVFTDDEAPPAMVAALREAGIDVREVGPPAGATAAGATPARPAAPRGRSSSNRGSAGSVPGARAGS